MERELNQDVKNRGGQIMLTDHGSDVAYRDFAFRPLTIAP
jgi:hypothetical protein